MQPVSYVRARDAVDAGKLAQEAGAMLFAGGTTVVDLMKLDVLKPALLVDVTRLPFSAIDVSDDSIRLGATARMSDVADHPVVRAKLPAIVQALEQSASGQLRNMATLGGNVLQRTRCAYFRDVATPCNKREPGSGCGALDGLNEEHAVLGTSDQCIAVHASDFAVPLVAFDAAICTEGPSGPRSIAAHDFFLPPGDHPDRETPLEPGELIVAIDVPLTAAGMRSTYVKVRDRTSYAFALASCAAGVERAADGTIADVRLALGGVATVPWRVRATEEALRGQRPAPDRIAAAARAAFDGARPTAANAYKIDLGVAVIQRALEAVCA